MAANKNIGLAAGGLIGLGLISYAVWQLQKDSGATKVTTFKVTNDTITTDSTTTTTSTTLPSFLIKDAYWNGSQFIAYSSKDDALDKNVDPDFTNRTATIYAVSMNSGIKAYSDVSGIVPYPAGKYYYETTGQMLEIATDGTMTFSSDVVKPNNLSANVITESYN